MKSFCRTGLALMACALGISCSSIAKPDEALRLTPAQAVFNAAQSQDGTTGVFEMVVRGSGRQNGRLFLNSESDYRAPQNLTVMVIPQVEKELLDRFERPLDNALLTKTIAVRGTAKTTRIWFYANGRRTEKYYFQTQIKLESARHLTVAGEPAFF